MIERAVAGLVLSVIVAAGGWRLGALTTGGLAAALVVGTLVVAGGGWMGFLLLGTFFVSSSALSRLPAPVPSAAKGSRRDASQVLANGGVAALVALIALPIDGTAAIVLSGGALAAATADTWATEIGSRSGHVPRMLLSRAPVPVGVSGGVTRPGTLGAAGGALLIGLVAAIGVATRDGASSSIAAGIAVALAGMAGAMVDSLLGEVAQGRRLCEVCGQLTEAPVHACGTASVHVAGYTWLDNDLVNAACTASGACVAALGLVLFV